MAKQRKGGEKASEPSRESAAADVGTEPVLHDQAALGNAALQGRMETGEVEVRSDRPGLDVVAAVAVPLVSRAMAALQLDPADAERLARRVEILENSRLPERQALVDQLHGDEAVRMTVDGLVSRHFGAADADTRWAIDSTLAAVLGALQRGASAEWVDAEGSLDVRSSALIASLASEHGSEQARAAAVEDVGRSTASLVRSLALMVLLDEEEEEEGFVEDGWEIEGA